jgi:2-oxoglutarate ferredoxin oxidoreductase subunit alpha
MARRLPEVGGVYVQMEDEIGSIGSVIGASWTGTLAMTATSGPGMSLMQENIGYAVGTETPCVIVDVQRGGPATGIPAVPMQGDMVQALRGSHGEYEAVAFVPSSAQEMFDLTVLAFSVSEELRTPVFLMADAAVGHMREVVDVPAAEEIQVATRRVPEIGTDPGAIQGFLDEDVAPMPVFGRGHKAHVTGSCHDAHGMRNVVDASALDFYVRTLKEKIHKRRHGLAHLEAERIEDAKIVLMGYGIVGRAARSIAMAARETGIRAGSLRPITLWPFPEEEIRSACEGASRVLVLENNLGQMYPFVRAALEGGPVVESIPPRVLGTLHRPDDVMSLIREVA